MCHGIQTSVAAMARGSARVARRSAPWGIVAFLVAGAVTPLVLPMLVAAGEVPTLSAGFSGQLGNVGSDYVAHVLLGLVERLRSRGVSAVSDDEARDLITAELMERLGEGDEDLQDGLAVLLRSIGGVEAAVTEAVASGSADVQQALSDAFTELGATFARFDWMLEALDSKVVDIRQDTEAIRGLMAGQQAEQRRQTHLLQRMLLAINVFGARSPSPAESEPSRDPAIAEDGTPSPYKGLATFEPEDAHLFFGREALTATVLTRLAERIADPGLLVLIGPSGSGKSSLLRAGVLPAMARGVLAGDDENRPWLLITPGEHPVGELAEWTASLAGISAGSVHDDVLADPGRYPRVVRQALRQQPGRADRLILVVDQFEEVFTQCHEEAERRAFIEALCAAAESVAVVVIGVRADFYPQCAAYPELVAALQNNQTIEPMSAAEVREAIERPARAAGLELGPGLMEVLLADLGAGSGTASGRGHAAGALPLLSHALYMTWRRRQAGELTVAGYRASGGIAGAVAATAKAIHDGLDKDGRAEMRRLLLRLVTIGDGTEDTRRRVSRDELFPHGGTRDSPVLDRLVAERLVTVHETTVEITHEALLSAWPLLRTWLNEDREGLRVHRRLTLDAAAWHDLGRDPGSVYRGTRLDNAREWTADPANESDLSPLEREFLRAGTEMRARQEESARRRVRRLRILASGLAVALVLVVVAGGVAFWQRRSAVAERQVALSRQLAADSTVLIAGDPDLASLLAIQAYRTSRSSEAVASLYAAAGLPLRHRLTGHTDTVDSVAFSPDGRTLATGSFDGTVRLWDVATGTTRTTLSDRTRAVRSVAFSPDGRTLATGSFDGTVRLWDVATGTTRSTLMGHTAQVLSVMFSPDGRTLATASFDHTVRLWDVATGTIRTILRDHTRAVLSVAFSPDGNTLASGGEDHTVRLWDVARGTTRTTLRDHTQAVQSVAFSPDGRTLATASSDHTVRLRNAATGTTRTTLRDRTRAVRSVAFSPDGRTLATGNDDGTVRLWDPATGTTRTTITGHTGQVLSAVFSPDGRSLATGSEDHTARLWDVAVGTTRTTLAGHGGAVQSVVFSPDGRTLATGDGTARLWDVATGTTRTTLAGHGGAVQSVVFSSDGRTLATAGFGGTVRLWDVATGTTRATLTGQALTMAFSPDGRTLATGSNDGTVRLWDVATGTIRATLTGNAGQLAFSPDGRTLAIGSNRDGTVRLFNAATRTVRTVLTGHTAQALSVVFSPDGRTLATASFDHTVRLWDVATGTTRTTLSDRTRAVDSVAFSPDGRTLATASLGGTVRLWDVATGTIRATLTGHTDTVHSVAFSPDGRTLATGSNDTTVRLWDVSLPGLPVAINRICRAVHRDFTPQERSAYLQGRSTGTACPL